MLVGCSASKREGRHPAGELYTGEVFRLASALAMASRPAVQRWFVLSARWGLLPPSRPTDAYDAQLRRASDRARWCEEILPDIVVASSCVREPVRLVVIAGSDYRGWIGPFLEQCPEVVVKTPLEGLGIGHQRAALRNALAIMRAPGQPWQADERWEMCLRSIADYRSRALGLQS